MKRKWLIGALIAAAGGCTLAGLSTSRHMRLLREGTVEASYCSLSEKINCDLVDASSYSELLGVPIAWWGFLFYLAVGGMALLAYLSRKERRDTAAAAWLLSCATIPYCLFLAYVSTVILGVLCLECAGMYLVSAAFVVFLFLAMGLRVRELPAFLRDYSAAALRRPSSLEFAPNVLRHAAALAALYLIGWAFMGLVQAKEAGGVKPAKDLETRIAEFRESEPLDVRIDPDWPLWGSPSAKVVLVEFSDFQCPHCRRAAFQIKPSLQEFKGDIGLRFVHYPLDNACNSSLDWPMHPMACFAARASICAQKRGAFWPFHDELYRNQKRLNKRLVLETAESRGWDWTEFLACLRSEETKARLARDIEAARRLKIDGTPILLINGRKLPGWRDRKLLQAVIREEIERSGG